MNSNFSPIPREDMGQRTGKPLRFRECPRLIHFLLRSFWIRPFGQVMRTVSAAEYPAMGKTTGHHDRSLSDISGQQSYSKTATAPS